MYKTIRHGENSLQYTILPQTDDFRIGEGKLTSAESSCSNSGRKSKGKRPRRRSFFAYLGLIFVCTVIVGAVLIPFLVSAECLPNPTSWFLNKNIPKHDKSANGLKNIGINAVNGDALHNSNFIGSGINVRKTVKIVNQDGIEKVIVKVNKTSSNATDKIKSNLISKFQNNSENEVIQVANDKVIDPENLLIGSLPRPTIKPQSIPNVENQNIGNSNQAQVNAQLVEKDTKAQTEAQAQIIYSDQMSENIDKNLSNNPPNDQHFVTEVRFEPVETVSSKPSGIIPNIVVTTLRNQFNNNNNEQIPKPQSQINQPFIVQSQTAPNIRPTTILSNSNSTSAVNNGSNNSSISTLMTRIIQVPLLKSAAKKPIIPPVLIKTTNSQYTNGTSDSALVKSSPHLTQQIINKPNTGETLEKSVANDWIHSHWPFVDPSTYFQWTGYKAEDSVLFPALLGFALIGIILFITVCLVARNKRTIISSVRKRNRNVSDVEENGAEDNTTLLTTANLSDED